MRAPALMDKLTSDSLLISYEREDFSDYLWMEDVESFDKQVLAELEEEEEMEQCMEEMLAEEEARDTTYYIVDEQSASIIPCPMFPIIPMDADGHLQSMANLNYSDERILLVSELNPNAAEFVPSQAFTSVDSSKKSGSTEAPDR